MNTSSQNEYNNGPWISHLISNSKFDDSLFNGELRGIRFKSRSAAVMSTIKECKTS